MYGGICHAVETALPRGARLADVCVDLTRSYHQNCARKGALTHPERDSTRENPRDDPVSSIGAAGVFSYMLSSLYISRSPSRRGFPNLDVNRWGG